MQLSPADRVLIVGAGFAGAVHARVLAEAGVDVAVIDRRPHVAGNAYDARDARGIRVHQYGPHLFHTNEQRVVDWLFRFGEFTPYEHRVSAIVGDRHVPLPLHRATFEAFFGCRFESKAALESVLAKAAVPHAEIHNAGQHLESRIGKELTDLFFRPYTLKMWGLDLEDMDASVVKRIPIRLDDEDRYFPNDRFQVLPKHGYTRIFENILDHHNIHVSLSTPFDKKMITEYDGALLSCPIDEFFDYRFGELPYRSIRFHHHETPAVPGLQTATVNYTDAGSFTRETHWHLLPEHDNPASLLKTRTVEEPCDYRDNAMERYYPVRDARGQFQARYRSYADLAEAEPKLHFIGRCGTYTYLDMHQVINQSLQQAPKLLASGLGAEAPRQPVDLLPPAPIVDVGRRAPRAGWLAHPAPEAERRHREEFSGKSFLEDSSTSSPSLASPARSRS